MPLKEELLIPLQLNVRGIVEPVTHVRSTLIAASLMSLKDLGHLEAYLKQLPAPLHDTILHTVAGTWLSLDVGVAHYKAAEALGLTLDQQLSVGREVADRVQKSVLGTLVKMAKGAGVTPWMGLEYAPKLWVRVLQGGSVALYRLGPKEARIEFHGAPQLAEIAYFRTGFRGMFLGSGMLFSNKLYVHDLPRYYARKVVGFQVSWA